MTRHDEAMIRAVRGVRMHGTGWLLADVTICPEILEAILDVQDRVTHLETEERRAEVKPLRTWSELIGDSAKEIDAVYRLSVNHAIDDGVRFNVMKILREFLEETQKARA